MGVSDTLRVRFITGDDTFLSNSSSGFPVLPAVFLHPALKDCDLLISRLSVSRVSHRSGDCKGRSGG